MEAGATVSDIITNQGGTFGLALDERLGRLFWLLLNEKKKLLLVRGANLDGSEANTIVERGGEGLEGGLALDPAAGQLYWAEPRAHAIAAANLDGGEVRTLFGTGQDAPVDVAVETLDPRPATTLAPFLEGSGQVGRALVCNPGSWSGIGPVSFAYGWALGGSTLEGVSGQLYVPSADQAGATISCVVSATDNVVTSTQASAPVRVLTPGEPPGDSRPRLLAGIAVTRIHSSGRRARIPVFSTLACRATLKARPVGARARRKARGRRSVVVAKTLRPGRSTITLSGLVPGTLYALSLTVSCDDGESARDHAGLRMRRRT